MTKIDLNETPRPERLLNPAAMRARCGDISEMTIHRWLRTDGGFPQPVYIGTRRFWRESEIDAWIASRQARGPAPVRGAAKTRLESRRASAK